MMRNVFLDVLSISVAAEFGFFPPLFFFFFFLILVVFLYLGYLRCHVSPQCLYCYPPSQCRRSTVYSCDILSTLKAKWCIFFKQHWLKVCVCKDTHLRSSFFYGEWTVSRNTIYYCGLQRVSAEPLFFHLCVTLLISVVLWTCNKYCTHIQWSSDPVFFSHYVPVSFICH